MILVTGMIHAMVFYLATAATAMSAEKPRKQGSPDD